MAMPSRLVGRQERCPRCDSEWVPCVAMNGAIPEHPTWFKCSNKHCGAYYWSIVPLEHQEAFLRDEHIFTMSAGAYGSAKTSATRMSAYKHIMITPNGRMLIGANVTSQYENTIKAEFEEDFPEDFVLYQSSKYSYVDFINGCRLLYRPLDDVDKLRSYNLSWWAIIEGSEVDPEAWTQLRTRTRNTAATVPILGKDGKPRTTQVGNNEVPVLRKGWRKGIIETNPDSGWVKDELLLKADTVQAFGDVVDFSGLRGAEGGAKNSDLGVILSSSSCNPYLPPGYIQQVSAGKPAWWVLRYVNCSFLYSEARVYPKAEDCFVTETFQIPKTWKRILGHDWGLVDPSVFLIGAIDPDTGILWIYDEVRVQDKNVNELARFFKELTADVPASMWYTTPLIDPVSGYNRNAEKKTLADLYLEHGIVWQPGQKSMTTGIFRVNTYIETGKIKIFQTKCSGLCDELPKQLFKKDTKSASGYIDVPEDHADHAVACLRWICCALPENPALLLRGNDSLTAIVGGGYDEYGRHALHMTRDDDTMWQFSENETETSSNMWLPDNY